MPERVLTSFTVCGTHHDALTGQFSLGAPLWNCAILTPNSQICVSLMVSAPIYVAQRQMSY